MANPPIPNLQPNPVVTHGTILHYGLEDLVVPTALLVDSYKRDEKFANTDEVTNNMGVVVGLRMSDFRVSISVSGRILTTGTYPKVGDILSINGDNGVITDIGVSGEAKGFSKLDIKAECYSGVTGLAPYND